MASNAAEVAVDFFAVLNGVGIALDGLPFVNWQARAICCPPSQKQTRMMVAAVGAVEVSCWRKVGPLIAVQTVAAPLNNDPIQNDCSVAGVDRESVLAALQHMNKCQVATDLALLMTEALLCSDGVRLELLSRSMGRGRVVKSGMGSTEASLRYPGLVLLHHDTDVDACDVECLLPHDGPSHVLLHVDVLFEDLRTVRMYVELTPGQIADLPASAKKQTFWKAPTLLRGSRRNAERQRKYNQALAARFGAILGHRFGGVERVRPRQGGFSGAAGEITQGANALRAG